MKLTDGLERRGALRFGASLVTLGAWNGLCRPAAAQTADGRPDTIVAYFSRSGHTRVIAGQLSRARAAALFEIRPFTPYPDDLDAVVTQDASERETGAEPPLAMTVPNVSFYETVFLGCPVWGATVPGVVRTFLSVHDLSEKTIVPFITHSGYGIGDSMTVIARHAPRSRIHEPFIKQAEAERDTLAQVTRWLGDSGLGR